MKQAFYNIPNQVDGDSFEFMQFNLVDANDNPIDLTGVTVKIQFRKEAYNGKLVKEIDTTSGINWIDQTLGQFKIDSFIIDWGDGKYYYDIQYTYPTGEVKTYVYGYVNVLKQVTV